jgi:hypothetical protein
MRAQRSMWSPVGAPSIDRSTPRRGHIFARPKAKISEGVVIILITAQIRSPRLRTISSQVPFSGTAIIGIYNTEMESSSSSQPDIAASQMEYSTERPLDSTMSDFHRVHLTGTKSPRSVVDYRSNFGSASQAESSTHGNAYAAFSSAIALGSGNPLPLLNGTMGHFQLRPRDSSQIWDRMMESATLYHIDDTNQKEPWQPLSESDARFPYEIFFPEL